MNVGEEEEIKSRNLQLKALGDIILIIVICFNISCLIYRRRINYRPYLYPRHMKKFENIARKNIIDVMDNPLFDHKSSHLTERLTFDIECIL